MTKETPLRFLHQYIYIESLHTPSLFSSASATSAKTFLVILYSATATMSSPYPSAYQIEEMFANRLYTDVFNSYLADNVDVLVVGGEDFHIGGRYNSVQSFHDAIYGHVSKTWKVETAKMEVLRVIGGGDSPWAAVESVTTATTKYGESVSMPNIYTHPFKEQENLIREWEPCSDKPYANLHVDLVRFNSEGKIAQLRHFFDTRHVHDHVEEHESKTQEAK